MGLIPAELANIPPWLIFLLTVWSLVWKGIALWRAAKQDQRNWFIALLVVNTVGILEIIYLYIFAPRKATLKSSPHKLPHRQEQK